MPKTPKKKLTLEERIDLIEPTWRDTLNGLNAAQLRDQYALVAKNEEANQSSKKADADLQSKRDAVKAASLGYSDITKRNRLKTKLLIRMLSDNGDVEAQTIVKNDAMVEAMKG